MICYVAFMMMAIGFFFGFWFASHRKDDFMWNLCLKQQERGDYWFDKYQKAIDNQWKPLSENFDG
jgi:hypothetical protein